MPHYGTTGTYRIIQGGPVENALGLANPTPNAPPPTPRVATTNTSPVLAPNSPTLWMHVVSRFYSDPANVYESASRPVSASMSPASAYSGYDASVSDMTEDGHNDDGYDDYDAYYDDDERTLCCDVQDHGDESPEVGCLACFPSSLDGHQPAPVTAAAAAAQPQRSRICSALLFVTAVLGVPVDVFRHIASGAAAGAEGDDDNDDDEQPEMSSPPPQGDDPRPRVRRRPSARRDKFPPGPSPLSYPPLLSRTLPSAE
ncbi:hypothetical protein VFPFJ_08781 [Purpureocillium lilacinum]|uniref:Uncharacterized protein n=1 Tax=Purpureocillium lilacinum TaxID=33203 RepID=A0A179GAM2_PURLI|nr:hypothetical protein VFPFJ_08781 [Purpureocillium lilacinum]OAQ74866.1 hypothetical protein VFPBJ_10161 [Purpureocillium lilacinum]OAQ82978.1 hypothetical protein VFPFJ_08781 [Purpureocillium lilacinum]